MDAPHSSPWPRASQAPPYVASRTHLEPLPRHASLKEFVHVLVDVHQVPILLRIQLIHPRVHV